MPSKDAMLWYDGDPAKGLAVRVVEAVEYYTEKYCCPANVCQVHPSMLDQGCPKGLPVRLEASKQVMRNYILVGVSEDDLVTSDEN